MPASNESAPVRPRRVDPVDRARAATGPKQGERLLTAGLAGLTLIATLVPWWNSELPLAMTAPWLNLWGMLLAGLSIPPWGPGTGFGWFGNVLFGLLGTLPTVALLVALVVRALRPASIRASLIRQLGIAAVLGAIWIFAFAWIRQDAANGRTLTAAGPWLMLAIGIAAAVLGALWWRREKHRYPSRVKAEPVGGAESEEGRLEELVGLDLDGDGDVGTERGDRTRRAPEAERFAFTAEDAEDDDAPDTGSISIDTLRDDADR